MMLKNHAVYQGSKDPTKGAMTLVKDKLTRREANELAAQLRRNEHRAAVYRGTNYSEPRSFF